MAKKWHCKHALTSLSGIAAKPGLYAYGYEEELHGLMVCRKYVYIGETDNLRRRLREHMPDREQNIGFKKCMKRNLDSLKCWYVYWPGSSDKRKSAEMDLIKKFDTPDLLNKAGVSK